MALISEANIAGKTIVTYNLHLESKGDDQLRGSQLDEALEDARRYSIDTPILLTGDFNLDLSRGPAAAAISRAEFRMRSRISMRLQLRTRAYRKDESLTGSLRGDRFALANLRSNVPCRRPTITHCRLRSVSVDAAGASQRERRRNI